jgi:hypothetical protein
MSMFEFFSAGMPLFFPSKHMIKDIQSVSAYWGPHLPKEVTSFSDTTKWLDLADFYHVFLSPNVYIYDSFEHLIQLLQTFVWKDDREALSQYRNNIRNSWLQVLKPVLNASGQIE